MLSAKQQGRSTRPTANLTVPELEQSKISVLASLPSAHSRRTYRYAIERFIGWYCSAPPPIAKGSLRAIGRQPNFNPSTKLFELPVSFSRLLMVNQPCPLTL
jgi:hypothetical protein